MVQVKKEDTEFSDYSSDSEDLYFIRRGRLRILISVDKSRQDISIDEEQIQPDLSDKDLQALISKMEISGRLSISTPDTVITLKKDYETVRAGRTRE